MACFAKQMFFYLGVNEIGRVERCGATYVGTDFVVFNFVPLVPMRSWVHGGDGTRRAIPLHLVSILAAYLRAWGAAGAVLALAIGRGSVTSVGLAVLGALLSLIGFTLVGRVSADEAAKRAVTARAVGAPVALRHVRGELAPLREELAREFAQAVATLGAGSYRGGETEDVALTLEDRDALRTAFTLARIDEMSDDARVRSRAHERAEALWARMKRLGQIEEGALTRPSSAPSST